MASPRRLVAIVALFVVACTQGSSPQPTAPPDAFAPTPTISGEPTTTTRRVLTTTVDTERAIIQRVDPRTLEPLPDYEPIPMGDWVWGMPSSDGRFFAAITGDDRGGPGEVRLVDVEGWTQLASWREPADVLVYVNAHGTVFFHRWLGNSAELRMLATDSARSEVVAEMPVGLGSWGWDRLIDQRYLTFGSRPGDSANSQQPSIAVADLDAGTVEEIPLPEIRIGQVDPVSQGPWAPYLYVSPSVSWDPIEPRALVVHGDEAVVSEVDLRTGEVTERPIDGDAPNGRGIRRSSAIDSEGRLLYVSNRTVELIEDDDDWSVHTEPSGIVSIDTTTWQVVARTDAPVSDVFVSPDGGRLFASGYSTEESESVYVSESTGLYVLDAGDLSVIAHHAPERGDQSYGPVTFNPNAGAAYVSSWTGASKVHAIDLDTGEILATAESPDFVDMVGPIGVLATSR